MKGGTLLDVTVRELNDKVISLEKKVEKIQKHLTEQNIADVKLQGELKALQCEVLSIKQDVITTLNDHSKKTWDLINKGIKVICVLVGIICLMAGVKLLPDILKLLGGV